MIIYIKMHSFTSMINAQSQKYRNMLLMIHSNIHNSISKLNYCSYKYTRLSSGSNICCRLKTPYIFVYVQWWESHRTSFFANSQSGKFSTKF